MNICVYGASSNTIDNVFIAQGEALGRLLAENGHTLVFGGGNNGMMGAVARGAKEKSGKVIGIAPKFFDADGVLFKACDEFIYPETMRERKGLLDEMADGFIVTAGGVGTFDEFFEIFTLKQLGRHNKPIVVLNTDGYFNSLKELLENAINRSFMTRTNLGICHFTKTPEAAIKYISEYTATEHTLDEFKDIEKR